MDRFLCRWRSAIVGVSKRVRRDIIENLRVPPEMARVIYNGVEIDRFADTSLREPARRELGIAPDTVVVCYHGRLVNQKNPETLVELATHLRDTGHANAMVLVAGDGPRREELEAEATRRNLGGAIRFLGRRDDIPSILQASDIAVLPSSKEGFSNALVEAMAAGLPPVATDVGGNAEAVEDGRSGYIIQPGDVEALKTRVAEIVDNPDLRAAMSQSTADRARKFSLNEMIREVEKLYLEFGATE